MEGGDSETLQRQSSGLFGMMGRMLGLGPRELQQQMLDPVKQQMLMQRGGFPWALCWLEHATYADGERTRRHYQESD